jgi:hypothetical protein
MPPQLVIPGLPVADSAAEGMPDLPALEELLRLAGPAGAAVDWRRGLLQDIGAAEWADAAPASIAAAALSLPADAGVCLAVPVHAVAGVHRVHLHGAGAIRLDAGECQEFATGFAAQFGGELRLHALASGWVLEGESAAAASDADPLELLGAPLQRSAATSPPQRQLRRLGAEIEMWLADLPWNARRQRRGDLPVNLVWLWGGGRVRPDRVHAPHPALRIHAAQPEPWLAGCAALAGGEVLPLPASWSALADPESALVVLGAGTWIDASVLLRWEAQWFEPALEALRSGRIAQLDLRLGRRVLRVRRRVLQAFWRRARPWWQAARA